MSTGAPQHQTSPNRPRLYDDEGGLLLDASEMADRIIMLPTGRRPRVPTPHDRIRIQWGQHLTSDLVSAKYRTFVCGVNAGDNSRGIISQIADVMPGSQWSTERITSYAQMFARSINSEDDLVIKYDLDSVEIFALLRPPAREHFTLDDLYRGFRVVAGMLEGRRDRMPCASVSFLGAKANCVREPNGEEPSFETVLRVMYDAGYRGDVYPTHAMWELAPTGVFANYPFPESLDRMRAGGF